MGLIQLAGVVIMKIVKCDNCMNHRRCRVFRLYVAAVVIIASVHFCRETNSLVEEFMLFANIAVARKILEEFPDCALLRRHPSPPASNYDELVKVARTRVR